MALPFHPLPTEVFPPEARPHISRLNYELRDLFGLEGVIRNPLTVRRSDGTIVRRNEVQVDVSRITPSLSAVIAGTSAMTGLPSLVFGTVNATGSSTGVVAVK